MKLEKTATRVWKRLTREERVAAAQAFFAEPPREILGAALAAMVKFRHLRPQVARTLPPEEQGRLLGSVLEPGEMVASALLVSLHLPARRPMLVAFLDAMGLPHEDGVLKDEADNTEITEDLVRKGTAALGSFPPPEVETYLNTLWLQDPDRWGAIAALESA